MQTMGNYADRDVMCCRIPMDHFMVAQSVVSKGRYQMTKTNAGKGSTQRPTDTVKYGKNYDDIFRKKKKTSKPAPKK